MKNFTLVIVLLCVAFANAFKFYQDRIPNGDLVPHPCKPNYLWKGVGHFNVLGGGERNPFGVDFSKYGRTWNREICNMDSDGDGKSNGQELGDPGCVWTPEGSAPTASATGHPGVCEPVDSEVCKTKNAAVKDSWEFCNQGEFECDAINQPDVQNLTIAIQSGTKVPAQETTYMCQLVKLPDDQQYHIIASKPAIDNQIVAHHIIIYGCDVTALETVSQFSSPQICDPMVSSKCTHNVGGWTVGQDGYCELPGVGVRFGKRVFNYAMIEIHWNNPMEEANYVDGSGLTIFYTPNLRKYDAGGLTIGQQSLAIPANVETHYHASICTSDCTDVALEKPLYIYSVLLHMHYLGRGGRVEQWRNGSLLQILVDNSEYSYDTPVFHKIDPPAVFQPGDELRMFCKFNSKSRSEMTYFGEGTADEMCYAFLTYYPKSNFKYCTSFGPLDICYDPTKDPNVQLYESVKTMGCDMGDYEEIIEELVAKAEKLCGGYEEATCNPECSEFLQQAYTEKMCLRNGLRFLFEALMSLEKTPEAERKMKILHVCDENIIPVNSKVKYYDKAALTTAEAVDAAPSRPVILFLLASVATILGHC